MILNGNRDQDIIEFFNNVRSYLSQRNQRKYFKKIISIDLEDCKNKYSLKQKLYRNFEDVKQFTDLKKHPKTLYFMDNCNEFLDR